MESPQLNSQKGSILTDSEVDERPYLFPRLVFSPFWWRPVAVLRPPRHRIKYPLGPTVTPGSADINGVSSYFWLGHHYVSAACSNGPWKRGARSVAMLGDSRGRVCRRNLRY